MAKTQTAGQAAGTIGRRHLTGAGRRIARNRNYAVGNQARAMRSAAVFKTQMSPTRFKRATGTGGH